MSWPVLARSLALALAAGATPSAAWAQDLWFEPPQRRAVLEASSDEAGRDEGSEAEEALRFEAAIELTLTHPKFRLREGSPVREGTSLRSGELGLSQDELGGGAQLAVWWGAERFALHGFFLDASSAGTLREEAVFGGARHPAGTPVDVLAMFRHVDLMWTHRFQPLDWLGLDVGLQGSYRLFRARTRPLGDTTLQGFYATPRLRVAVTPLEGLELWGAFSGFYLTFPNDETRLSDIATFEGGVRYQWRRLFVDVGYRLYSLHMEEHQGTIDENVVHMRLRSVVFALGVTF